jgi:hypothetical protein
MSQERNPRDLDPPKASNPGYQYSKPVTKRLQMFLPDGSYGESPDPRHHVIEMDGGAVSYLWKIGR